MSFLLYDILISNLNIMIDINIMEDINKYICILDKKNHENIQMIILHYFYLSQKGGGFIKETSRPYNCFFTNNRLIYDFDMLPIDLQKIICVYIQLITKKILQIN